jgi:type 1 glutamine amidotransferase
MRTFWYGLASILLLVLVMPASAAPVPAAKDEKKRLLVITESKGFRHSCVTRKGGELSLVEKTLAALGEKNGFDVICSQDSRAVITAENLKNFDAVFFYTTGELPLSDTQKADLLRFVRSGKGFAGSHSATDTFYRWTDYGNLIGGYFNGHPWHKKITVLVEDTKHPATKHLGDSFTITDEIYQFRAPYDRSKLHVLMRMDMKGEKSGSRKDNDNALAWTHEYGKGQVFYTALGHRDEVWKDERFQKHLVGGLRYVFGLESADSTPSSAPKRKVKPAKGGEPPLANYIHEQEAHRCDAVFLQRSLLRGFVRGTCLAGLTAENPGFFASESWQLRLCESHSGRPMDSTSAKN